MDDTQNNASLIIYLRCIEEAKHRLVFVERFTSGVSNQARVDTEAACLQMRKALELIAYAAIAPHKTQYEAWRKNAVKNTDFRRDYNGRKILHSLATINPYSYPKALIATLREGTRHYDSFKGPYLTKKLYEEVYDMCGKLLHADNPWGVDKPYDEFRQRIPEYVNLTRALLNVHGIMIQHETGTAAWVIEFGDLDTKAKGHIGQGQPGIHVPKDYYD